MHTHTSTVSSTHFPARSLKGRGSSRRRCFSLTELLVVIGIIVLLVGLLLVALRQVQIKARRTKTEATMQQFANAITAFQTEHGSYPGVIPDGVLLANLDPNTNQPRLSCTENALLHLSGGYRVLKPTDVDIDSPIVVDYNGFAAGSPTLLPDMIFNVGGTQVWKLKIDTARIGEGPVIEGKPYAPYFTPKADQVAILSYPHSGGDPTNAIPDLVDAWGQPIVYIKQARDRGPLVDLNANPNPRPQFLLAGVDVYLSSLELAELGENQTNTGTGTIFHQSLSTDKQNEAFSVILGHPAFYKNTDPLFGSARGGFMLLSAGPDGVYFSAIDGPGSEDTPIDDSNIDQLVILVGPKVIDEFDDVRVYGGG